MTSAFPPRFLLVVMLAIATAWTATNPFGLASDPDAPKDAATLRGYIAEAVRLLTRPD